ncbi:hypothetical protein AVEN_108046-1, partial [Araneus ventricosus]
TVRLRWAGNSLGFGTGELRSRDQITHRAEGEPDAHCINRVQMHFPWCGVEVWRSDCVLIC